MSWVQARLSLTFALLLPLVACAPEARPTAPPYARAAPTVSVKVATSLQRLLEEEDADGDRRITVADTRAREQGRGSEPFWLAASDGKRYPVAGTYYLSNLLQELKLAQDAGLDQVEVSFERVFEEPVERISRSIRDLYWDGLTRRMDRSHLSQMLPDQKMDPKCIGQTAPGGPPGGEGARYLYVPSTDPDALAYYRQASKEQSGFKLIVVEVPVKEEITPEYVRDLGCRNGALSLALEHADGGEYRGVPFVVPGGRFNEMYGWDSYFEALGLLQDGRVDLARAMVDNFVYEIRHYGMILNANRTYYLTRSQPPFLTSMALEVYRHLPAGDESRSWLKEVFRNAIDEYENVWMKEPRYVKETGLSRYYGTVRASAAPGSSSRAAPRLGPPPEVEEGHFDPVFSGYAREHKLNPRGLEQKYRDGIVRDPELDEFFFNDSCVRESGHDTTYRWSRATDGPEQGSRHRWTWSDDACHHFVTVDLNSLLYKIEMDTARTIEDEFGGRLEMPDGTVYDSSTWYERAALRLARMNQYLWDGKDGMFFDYDFEAEPETGKSGYISAATFYPLWAGLATPEQAELLVTRALPRLEAAGGIAASAKESRDRLMGPPRQWDYPYGWPPHQILTWLGLKQYGYDEVAQRLAYRWLYTITRNAVDYNGTIPEKFDVVERSHRVFAEYGNVGTDFAYITREGFGWMNASYQVGLSLLPPDLRRCLDRLVPPEWLFDR